MEEVTDLQIFIFTFGVEVIALTMVFYSVRPVYGGVFGLAVILTALSGYVSFISLPSWRRALNMAKYHPDEEDEEEEE